MKIKSFKVGFSEGLCKCVKGIAVALEGALFPRKCLLCGCFIAAGSKEEAVFQKAGLKFTTHGFSQSMEPYLCVDCSGGFTPVLTPCCPSCGIMFKSREGEDHLCAACQASKNSFRIARASGVYDRTLLEVIHCLKYRGKVQLARPLGQLLFSTFIQHWGERPVNAVIPVPLHGRRLRKRGFNQAYLLVKDWRKIAERMSFKFSAEIIKGDILVRRRWTEPQTGLGRKKRMMNLKKAFHVKKPSRIKGKWILLVDDVYTTGATVNECAKELVNQGACRVDVLTLARTV